MDGQLVLPLLRLTQSTFGRCLFAQISQITRYTSQDRPFFAFLPVAMAESRPKGMAPTAAEIANLKDEGRIDRMQSKHKALETVSYRDQNRPAIPRLRSQPDERAWRFCDAQLRADSSLTSQPIARPVTRRARRESSSSGRTTQ